MSEEPNAASCDPTRYPKQHRTTMVTVPAHNQQQMGTVPALAKRGRKPGPLSRSARETQRKLNHSIIEKARRTKINDALATLRQLVPPDYGYSKTSSEELDDTYSEEEEDTRKKKKKKPVKKEKEKEFKLEILVRTVSFIQDLLERAKVLESAPAAIQCAQCATNSPAASHISTDKGSSKRRYDDVQDHQHQDHSSGKRSKGASASSVSTKSNQDTVGYRPPSSPELLLHHPYQGSRLPPISSWLPRSNTQNSPLPNHTTNQQQLPSPPSSTHFVPIQAAHVPPMPALNLGPILSPHRTTEDESAASLLLRISGSSPRALPAAGPVPDLDPIGGGLTSFDMSKIRTSCITPIHSGSRMEYTEAQTPGSILGLRRG